MSLIFRVSLLINLARKVSRQPKDGAKASSLDRPRNSFNLINIALFNIFLFSTCTQAWTENVCNHQDKSNITCEGDGDIDLDRNIIYKNHNGLSLKSTGLNIRLHKDRTKKDPQGIKISTGRKNTDFDGDMSLIWNSGTIVTFGKKEQSESIGKYGDGLRVENWGKGTTSLTCNGGEIQTNGLKSPGISGRQRGNNEDSKPVNIIFSGPQSVIATFKNNSEGIVGGTKAGIGDTLVSANDGKVITRGGSSIAVRGFNMGGIAGSIGNVEVTASNLTVATEGDGSHGIVAENKSFGTSTVKASGSKISTSGLKSHGVLAHNDNNGTHMIRNESYIIRNGSQVFRKNISKNVELMQTLVDQYDGEIATSGNQAHGIFAISSYMKYDAKGVINQHAGEVKTQGDDAFGLSALIVNGSLKIIQGKSAKVTAIGLGSDGISAIGNKSVDIKIAGMITGGRERSQLEGNIRPSGQAPSQYGPDSISTELPSKTGNGVGIYAAARNWQLSVLSPDNHVYPVNLKHKRNSERIWRSIKFTNDLQVSIKIEANGEINALSDKAIKTDSGTAEIINDGTIIGTVSTWNHDDTFTNNAEWEIRNFQVSPDAKTNVIKRNTENIAVADFGGGYDRFINNKNATVQLKTVGSQSDGFPIYYSTSTISKYLPNYLNLNSESITAAGVEQAHIVNLERFENAGIITMADMETGGTDPVAGDVLVITSSKSANEPAGTSHFVSNGGELHIDTVLNDGEHDLTDVLVVDSVDLSDKATTLVVNNVDPDKGASTDIDCNGEPDDNEGILVIDVRGNSSDKNAFVLKNTLIAGDWEYKLHQTDGKSWFLHSLEAKPITNINFHDNSIYQSDEKNIEIGHLIAEVPDNCQSISIKFQLVSGQGDSDNSKVSLKDDKIILSDTISDDKKREISIRVQAELNNYKFSKALTIAVDNPIVISEQSDSEPKEPVTDEPVVEEPVTEKQQTDGLVVEGPEAEESATEEPVVNKEPAADESVVGEPKADEEPTNEELAAGGPVVDGAVTEEHETEKPVSNEEPAGEEPVMDQSVAADPVVESPVAEESIEEEPARDEPVVEEVVSKGSNSVRTVSEAESGCCINNQVSPIINPIIDNNAISYIVARDGAQNPVSKDINTAVTISKETNTLEDSVTDEADQSTIQTISNNGVSSPSAIVASITDISLNSNTIDEDKVRGTIIGDLSAVMTGDNQNISYHLVRGAGDTDNNKISISGNQLISTDVFDFERNSTLSIRVQAEIPNRPLFEKALTIAITDTEADGCINHQIASNNQYSPLPFISSAHASNGSSVVSNTSTIMWLLYFFALRFLHKSKKINERWKYLFIVGLTIPLVACGGAGAQSIGQC